VATGGHRLATDVFLGPGAAGEGEGAAGEGEGATLGLDVFGVVGFGEGDGALEGALAFGAFAFGGAGLGDDTLETGFEGEEMTFEDGLCFGEPFGAAGAGAGAGNLLEVGDGWRAGAAAGARVAGVEACLGVSGLGVSLGISFREFFKVWTISLKVGRFSGSYAVHSKARSNRLLGQSGGTSLRA